MYHGSITQLRALEERDAPQLHGWFSDRSLQRLIYHGVILPYSREDVYAFLQEQTRRSRGVYQFAIDNAQGRLVGYGGLTSLDSKNQTGEIGLVIGNEKDRGQGYGSDALKVLSRIAFEEMNLHKLKAAILEYNTASVRCFEKCGFQLEGILREEVFREGKRHDVRLYGLVYSSQGI